MHLNLKKDFKKGDTYNGDAWLHFTEKTITESLCIHFSQLRHNQENTD